MNLTCYCLVFLGFALAQPAFAQQPNVLVIGSSHSFSEGESAQADVDHEKPFNPTSIATHLEGILSMVLATTAATLTVNDNFEDICKDEDVDATEPGHPAFGFL